MSTPRIGRSLTPSMTCPMRSRTGRSRDIAASCSRSIVCIEKLDDLARLTEPGLFLRLFRARSACFERVGDGANDWVVAIEQVQVLLRIPQHEIQPRLDRQRQVRVLDLLAQVLR